MTTTQRPTVEQVESEVNALRIHGELSEAEQDLSRLLHEVLRELRGQ